MTNGSAMVVPVKSNQTTTSRHQVGPDETYDLLEIGEVRKRFDDLPRRATTVYKGKYRPESGRHSHGDDAWKPSSIGDPNLPGVALQKPSSGSNRHDRVLCAMVPDRHENLWKAKSSEEFFQVWVDCAECHHKIYQFTNILHQDVDESIIFISRLADGSANGLMKDWDMASIQKSGPSCSLTPANHRASTLPFMAIDLLYARTWGHLYRYDLESFVYILVWGMAHYDLKAGKRSKKVHEAFRGWVVGTMEERGSFKDTFMNSRTSLARDQIHDAVQPDFAPFWEKYVEPLLDLLSDAYNAKFSAQKKKLTPTEYDYDTCGGTITFHGFMAKIGHEPRWAKAEADDA